MNPLDLDIIHATRLLEEAGYHTEREPYGNGYRLAVRRPPRNLMPTRLTVTKDRVSKRSVETLLSKASTP